MDDFTSDINTIGELPVGYSATGTIEQAGDRDWFRISLVVGKAYTFRVRPRNNSVVNIFVYDSNGNHLATGSSAHLVADTISSPPVYYYSPFTAPTRNAAGDTIGQYGSVILCFVEVGFTNQGVEMGGYDIAASVLGGWIKVPSLTPPLVASTITGQSGNILNWTGIAIPQMAAGYNSPSELYQMGGVPSHLPPATSVTQKTVTVTTTMPEIPAAPTETFSVTSVVQELLNSDWNSWARSIDPLVLGGYVEFTSADGTTGAVLAIGAQGMDGLPISKFSHSIIVDLDGIHIHEYGHIDSHLRTGRVTPTSKIRIYRQPDNSIVYVVTTGAEVFVHTSQVLSAYPSIAPLYVYGYLYSSGDALTSTAFAVGTVQYGSA